jgi:hypothetical protein
MWELYDDFKRLIEKLGSVEKAREVLEQSGKGTEEGDFALVVFDDYVARAAVR